MLVVAQYRQNIFFSVIGNLCKQISIIWFPKAVAGKERQTKCPLNPTAAKCVAKSLERRLSQQCPAFEAVNSIHSYLNEINICFNYRRLEGERSIKRSIALLLNVFHLCLFNYQIRA
jgi:hypothetical protein